MVEDERRVQHEDLDHRLQNLAMQLFLKSSTYCTAVLKRVRSNLSHGYACSVADCSVAVKASREGLRTGWISSDVAWPQEEDETRV